jgi:hypothetical protein
MKVAMLDQLPVERDMGMEPVLDPSKCGWDPGVSREASDVYSQVVF